MKKSIMGLLGIGTACAACCTPLLAPLLAALGLSGVLALRIGSVSLDEIVCVYGPWIAGAGVAALLARIGWGMWRRRGATAACDCAAVCVPVACAPDAAR